VDPRLHFGLGSADTVDEVRIRWPDGEVEVRKGVKANEVLKVVRQAEAKKVKR
jgi:hypothetical protein